MRQTLLTLAFIVIGLSGQAQGTMHDYAFVSLSIASMNRAVLVNTSISESEEYNLNTILGKETDKDLDFFFKKVQKLESEGWKLIDTQVIGGAGYGFKYLWTMSRPKQ